MNKKIIGIGILVLALVVGVIGIGNLSTVEAGIAAIVTIDINPSVKLSLDEDDKIVEFKALNPDAKTLELDGVIGMDVVDATELIVATAIDAGFIDEEDLDEDYVLITAAGMNKNEELANDKAEKLKEKITGEARDSEGLQGVSVAIIKATKVEMFEAEGKKIPAGLYVVNGEYVGGEEVVSVKDFFSNKENKEKFEQKGNIVDKSKGKKIETLEKFMYKLENKGTNVDELRNELKKEGADVDAIQSQVKALWGNNSSDEEDGDEEKGNENSNKSDQSQGKGSKKK